ncbi:MAG: hypothetical protein EOP38_02385 [Rubrivivax sp.]|nr:MAG: hypothetical protein EOP38_02385 [Rubrivivax sp.]
MSRSSILGADRAPTYSPGRDTGSLGPSDTSDSGSDIVGEYNREESEQELADLHTPQRADRDTLHDTAMGSDSDASGTGERASAFPEHLREAGDISPDRITPALDGEDEALADSAERVETSDEWIAEDADEDELDEDELADDLSATSRS